MANKKNLLIIGAMVVVTVLAFLLINFFSGKGTTSSPSEVTEENLQKEIVELEQNLLALEVIFDGKEEQIDQLDELLQESYDRLASAEQNVEKLEEQLNQLERQGKVDKQTIAKLRDELNKQKGKINDQKLKAYKKEIDLLVRDNGMLTAIRDSLEIVQYKKDSLITDMNKRFNDCLQAGGKSSTDIGRNIPTEPSTATPVVDKTETREAGFYASNIEYQHLDKRNKAMKFPSAKNLSEILIDFDVEGVNVPPKVEWIYIVMTDPNGKEYVNENVGKANSGGKFRVNGISRTFTTKTRMEYSGKPQHIRTRFQVGDDFPNGQIKVFYYCDNKQIGKQQFFMSN